MTFSSQCVCAISFLITHARTLSHVQLQRYRWVQRLLGYLRPSSRTCMCQNKVNDMPVVSGGASAFRVYCLYMYMFTHGCFGRNSNNVCNNYILSIAVYTTPYRIMTYDVMLLSCHWTECMDVYIVPCTSHRRRELKVL